MGATFETICRRKGRVYYRMLSRSFNLRHSPSRQEDKSESLQAYKAGAKNLKQGMVLQSPGLCRQLCREGGEGEGCPRV